MATLSNSESRRLYSWWWDSHNSPKNSKWLQDNLEDMDSKVKTMIKLIEEDADSFARRAEMYYKKRPELMKLVEEFYRAYRALAERYNHATGELRQAHRTMEAAFPNQVPFMLAEDSPSESSANEAEPHTPETPHPNHPSELSPFGVRALKRSGPCSEAPDSGFGKKGLHQNEMFGEDEEEVPRKSKLGEEKERSMNAEISQLSNENQNLKTKVLHESERAGKAECEIQNLKQVLADAQAEKEAFLLQYQKNLEKISYLEEKLNSAQAESREIDERASKVKDEVRSLKEELVKLETERDAGCLQQEYLDRISALEAMIVVAQNDVKTLNVRAIKAETEADNLKRELTRLEAEKEAVLLEYNQCLKKISDFEDIISLLESEAKMLAERADKAETEVSKLEKALAELNEHKEGADLQYRRCLEKISKFESAISCAQEDVERLNNELLTGNAKLKNAEVKHVLLETSNQSLRLEADKLAKEIESKDQELVKKHEELEKLQCCLQNEQHHFLQIETTLHTLQDVHSQSQEEQRALALELKNVIQMLQDVGICKHDLEEEIRRVKDENQSLNEINSSSAFSMSNLQNEILSLREMKERLEEEVASQLGRSNNLEQEVHHLKEEIKTLNTGYQALMAQVEAAGLNPEFIQSSVKELQNENSKLARIQKQDIEEKEALLKKLASMEKLLETNAALESSLSDVNGELGLLREKVMTIQEEKYSLVAEKATLLSQLQSINENMLKLLEKNSVLEKSLSSENVKLESLREKSKNLEDICESLNNEKSNLLTEKGTLVIQLENIKIRLETVEKRYTELDVKYADLSKDKEATDSEVEKLRFALGVEKQEWGSFTLSSNGRLATLENHVHLLQEESRWRKKESEEELEKVMNAQFEIFILKKFIQDMEEKNYYLLIECQKHIEESRMTEKLISELERENLEQQVEAEILFDEIEMLRVGISQVFKALEIGPVNWCKEKIETEQIFKHLLGNIKEMKCFLSNNRDDKQRLWIENSILLILLEQLRQDVSEIELEKRLLDQNLEMKGEELLVVQNEKHEILEMNRLLTAEMIERGQRVNVLEAENESLYVKQKESQRDYLDLQEECLKVLAEKRSLLKQNSDLKEEKCMVDEENKVIWVIFESMGNEKDAALKAIDEDLDNIRVICSGLKKEVRILRGKLEVKESDNILLKDSIGKLDKELTEIRDIKDNLMEEVSSGKEFLRQKETELSEAERTVKTVETLNSELCITVAGLKNDSEESKLLNVNFGRQIKELIEDNANQNKEIANLRVVNRNLVSKLDILHKDFDEHRVQEENLTSALQRRKTDVELWEDEAASFYFDLQISSIREILYEDKVKELNGACESLLDESASKTAEIEDLQKRVCFMESEIEGLKAQLFACTPQIDSLRENIASLEQNTLFGTKHDTADGEEEKVAEFAVESRGSNCQEITEAGNSSLRNGIPDFEELQARIKAVEKVVAEEMDRLRQQESIKTKTKLEAAAKEIKVSKPKGRLSQQSEKLTEENESSKERGDRNLHLRSKKPETSELRNGALMKDIPLDQVSEGVSRGMSRRRNGRTDGQMLELLKNAKGNSSRRETFDEIQKHPFEPAEDDTVYQRFKDVNQKNEDDASSELQLEDELGAYKAEESRKVIELSHAGSKKKILERLASDAQKLTGVSTTVQELRRKVEANKKNKKAKGIDFETVKEQLEEFEESVTYLVDMNGKLTKNVKESLWCSDEKGSLDLDAGGLRRKRITEQARKVSEKLGRLQLEVQKVQYVLLKFDDEKKGRSRERFFRTRTSIILRDFIGSGKRSSERQKKARMCACLRPSPSGGVSPCTAS